MSKVVLENEAKDFSEANAPHLKYIELEPKDGRKLLEEVQSSPVKKLDVDIEDEKYSTGEWGKIRVRFIRPKVIKMYYPLYIHSARLGFGSTEHMIN